MGKIGIFDSGVGGITVLEKIKNLLPQEDIIYYGDTFYSPYGVKSKEEILDRCVKISNFLVTQGCKIIVIACNTATVAALEELKEIIKVPVIGVINPGARAAISSTKNKKVGIIATPFTVKNLAYTKEIKNLNKNIEVFESGCTEFCPMIEKGWNNFENRFNLLLEYLSVLPQDIDTLVLGCTHYPIIVDDIKKYFKGIIIDPAFETSKDVENTLKNLNLLNSNNTIGNITFYVSGDTESFKNIVETFSTVKVEKIYNKLV